jgi:hypothetical protein
MKTTSMKQTRKERFGDKTIGKDKNYGAHEGEAINPNFRARSAAAATREEVGGLSPAAERVLRTFYPNSERSRGRR